MAFIENKLATLLAWFGISIYEWKKTLSDLFAELIAGECYLRIRRGPDGQLVLERVLEIVKMIVCDPNNPGRGFLKEVSVTLPGTEGKTMERDRVPSGKIRIGKETPNEALVRETGEELELKPDEYRFDLIETFEEQGNPKTAYMGLLSVYVIHKFQVAPVSHAHVFRDEFTVREEDGTIHTFRWVTEEKKK